MNMSKPASVLQLISSQQKIRLQRQWLSFTLHRVFSRVAFCRAHSGWHWNSVIWWVCPVNSHRLQGAHARCPIDPTHYTQSRSRQTRVAIHTLHDTLIEAPGNKNRTSPDNLRQLWSLVLEEDVTISATNFAISSRLRLVCVPFGAFPSPFRSMYTSWMKASEETQPRKRLTIVAQSREWQ